MQDVAYRHRLILVSDGAFALLLLLGGFWLYQRFVRKAVRSGRDYLISGINTFRDLHDIAVQRADFYCSLMCTLVFANHHHRGLSFWSLEHSRGRDRNRILNGSSDDMNLNSGSRTERTSVFHTLYPYLNSRTAWVKRGTYERDLRRSLT